MSHLSLATSSPLRSRALAGSGRKKFASRPLANLRRSIRSASCDRGCGRAGKAVSLHGLTSQMNQFYPPPPTFMGIDIYARWRNQTAKERKTQITGFSTGHGHVGYLRESYHGTPYVTEFLVREAFDPERRELEQDGVVPISAKLLRSRLPRAIELCKERYEQVYKLPANNEETKQACQSFVDFVELCERKEAETGVPVSIYASY